MGIIANIKSVFTDNSSVPQESEILEKGSDSFVIDVPGNYAQEMTPSQVYTSFLSMVYVRAAIGLLQDSISQIPLKILREDRNGELVEDYRVRDSLFRKDLFSNPNPFFTYDEWISDIVLNYGLHGNAFTTIEVDKGRAELYSLDPLNIKIIPDKKNYVKTYEYGSGNNKVIYLPKQVGHVRTRTLSSLYFGDSPISTISSELNSLLYQNKYLLDYFKNSARPDGVLVTDGFLSPSIKERIRGEWQRLHSFVGGNSGKIAILSNGLDYKKIQDSLASTDLSKVDTFLARRVATAFRIPLLFFANSENVNFSTSTNVIKIFYRMAVRPIISRIEDRLTKLIREYYNDPKLVVRFQLHGLPGLVEDIHEYAKTLVTLVQGRVIVPNEARQMLNKVIKINLPLLEGQGADDLQQSGTGSALQPGQPQANPDKPRREGPDNTNAGFDNIETEISDLLKGINYHG